MINRYDLGPRDLGMWKHPDGDWCMQEDVQKLEAYNQELKDSLFSIEKFKEKCDTWQPIATAPRDGSSFMAYNSVTGPYQTWYNDSEPDRPGTEFPCKIFTNGHNDTEPNIWYPMPTHWQPLPEAP